MAASHTHPHSVMYNREPQPPSRPYTHPHSSVGLVPRDASSHQHLTIPTTTQQQPKTWHASPHSHYHQGGPQSLVQDKGYRSLPSGSPLHTIPAQQGETSVATLENARYRVGDMPRSEHPNDDRHFVLEDAGNCHVFGVFDGHDGPRAAGFASNYFIQYFSSEEWKSLVSLSPQAQRVQIPLALKEFFKAAERDFFNSIRSSIEERKQLQRTIPSVSTCVYIISTM